MKLKFWKYEGAGNDFVLLDGRDANFEPTPEQIAALCHRRRGIGADGAMILTRSERAEFGMRYFNSDGPEATMCGNGGRCIAWFADMLGIGGRVKCFEAIDGLHTAEVLETNGDEARIRLGMRDVEGVVVDAEGDVLLDTGSPHLVRFVESLDVDVVGIGSSLRYGPKTAATNGANINFVQVLGHGELALRTYERGVEDETLACGTGATASAIAAAHTRQPQCRHFTLRAQGGLLEVEFVPVEGGGYREVFLTGPARLSFSGEVELAD